MIFVDTNVFLRHLVAPAISQDRTNAERAAKLFRAVEDGSKDVTTSEAIIAEVVFILHAKRHYNTPRPAVVKAIKPLLRLRSFRMPRKSICVTALNIWETDEKLSFPDALGAAHARFFGYPLATFDGRLARAVGVVPYEFDGIADESPGSSAGASDGSSATR